MIAPLESQQFATRFPETTSQSEVIFSIPKMIDLAGQIFSARPSDLRRGFWKPHHNLSPLAKKIRQPITILSPWPKKFGNQSQFCSLGQKNLATNHPVLQKNGNQ